jgi:hypothetical protein
MNKPAISLGRLYMKHPQLKFPTSQNDLFLTYKQARSDARQVQTLEFRRKKEVGKVNSY